MLVCPASWRCGFLIGRDGSFGRASGTVGQVVNTVLLHANAFAGPSIAFHEQYPHVAMPVHREKGVRLSS